MASVEDSSNLEEKRGKAATDHDVTLATVNLKNTTNLSQLPSTSLFCVIKRSSISDSESSSDSEDDDTDILERVRNKLAKLYIGHEIDVMLDWMEEILKGLEELRHELSSLQRSHSCKPQVPDPGIEGKHEGQGLVDEFV